MAGRRRLRAQTLPSVRVVAESDRPDQITAVEIQVTVSSRHDCVQAREREWPIGVGSLDSVSVIGLQAFITLANR